MGLALSIFNLLLSSSTTSFKMEYQIKCAYKNL